MDTDITMRLNPERRPTRHATEQRLAAAGSLAAEMIDAGRSEGSEPTSQEIADAILRWLRTGDRG
jgi:hypothetical protein